MLNRQQNESPYGKSVTDTETLFKTDVCLGSFWKLLPYWSWWKSKRKFSRQCYETDGLTTCVVYR